MKKINWMPMLSFCLILVLCACSTLPAGKVRGKLVNKTGDAAQKISLQLLKVTDQQGDKFSWVASKYRATTDEKGGFAFDKVESGKYVISVLNVSFVLGGQPPSMQEMVIRGKDDKVLMFEVPKSKGIDLGELTWSK